MSSWWNAWWKRALVGATSTALIGLFLALALGYATPAQGATATSFSITVNSNAASGTINSGTSATLAETGLPSGATGTVTFTDSSSNVLCTATLPAAACTTATSLAPGTYTVSASYPGDANFSASSSTNTLALTVLAPTTTALSISPLSAVSGTLVTYSVTVTSGFGTPTGTVNVRTPGKGLCAIVLTAGAGSCSASTAPIGVTQITATYVGDANFARSFGSENQTVSRATPSLDCARLSGKATTTIKLAICTPGSTLNRTARGPGSLLTSGGTLTWSRSSQTTVVSLTSTSPGQGACPRNFVEHDVSGHVTGGSSLYTLAGDPVSIRMCESARSHSVKLVAGTQAGF
jgi:hypothetical protein